MRMLPPKPWLRRLVRDGLGQAVGRYGYTLARTDVLEKSTRADDAGSVRIPQGRDQAFSTTEYDVLPRDQFDVVRRDYYSPIPDLSRISGDVWERKSELLGVELDPDAGIDFVERELAQFVPELDVPAEDPGRPGTFFLHNTGFESVDAELLYAMIRFARPRRIIELGSGYSTLLINAAAQRNAATGAAACHIAYDPYPREHVLGRTLPEPSHLEAVSARDVSPGVFEALQGGDVLFVDTTHTVKLASDVNFIVLEILPLLRPGVIVHFHDIFLPWEYPRRWLEQMQFYWTEQYLLQAFLAFNREFSVIVPAQAVARKHPQRLARTIPSFGDGVSPGSFWLRRESSNGARRVKPDRRER
jgi:hypothetical protein